MAKIHYEPPAYFYKWRDLGFPWFVYAYDWVVPTLNTKMIVLWEREKSIPDQMAAVEVLEPAGLC